jgi:hypothetical protein
MEEIINKLIIALVCMPILLTNADNDYYDDELGLEFKEQNSLYKKVCTEPLLSSQSPWFIGLLYDCQQRELFIPYQLWTGASWDGNKNSGCMHYADTKFSVNGHDLTHISGPHKYYDKALKKELNVWSLKKLDRDKVQYYACHEKGIGRLYDRRPSRGERYFPFGRCKFPAGFGWNIGIKRQCGPTQVEITKIQLDNKNNFSSITFKWWYLGKNNDFVLNQIYVFKPRKSMVSAENQERIKAKVN